MDLFSAYLNLEEFYRRIYWSVPTATTVVTDAFTMSYSGIRWLNSANQFWFHVPLSLDTIQLRLAQKFFQKYGADYTINYAEPLMPGVGTVLHQFGFRERVTSPILMLEGSPKIRCPKPDIRIQRVDTQTHMAFMQLLYDIFFIGAEVSRCIVQIEHLLANSPMRHYIAYVDDIPVGCGSISLSHNIAGLWSIGTLRSYRKRGIASALIDFALMDAADMGVETSILLASPMGRPLYEEMGFRWIGDSIQYGPPIS